ncbi:MAG TPA: hypothetical protein VKM93_02530, partial [Terriglobia bacterium]|nr:hypothetical protein [Terriglobia bacterium]
MKYTSYTVQTNFGCTSPAVTEYGPTAQSLVSEIDLPDIAAYPSDKYTFTYETTPGDAHNPHYVTGRIASVTLPTGGTISYTYTGPNNGITCADGSAAGINRQTPDGTWTYTRSGSTTTLTSPSSNGHTTVAELSFYGIYETERQIFQDSTNGAALETLTTCYNGSGCVPSGTITEVAVTTAIGGLESEVSTYYNTYGLPTETDQYAFGSGAVGGLLSKTTVTYNPTGNCGVTNANVVDRACTVQVYNGGGTLAAQTENIYDKNGNLLTVERTVQGSTAISQSFAYNSNGTIETSTDFNGNETTYSYGDCNGGLVTSVQPPLIPATNEAWDCNGGALTSVTDPNTNATNFSYDLMWRPVAVTPPATATTNLTYFVGNNPPYIESSLTNSNGLTTYNYSYLDGLGRAKQSKLVGTSPNPTYVDTTYDSLGRLATASNPYQSSGDPSYGKDTYGYDALSRVTSVTHADSNSRTIAYGAAVGGTGVNTSQLCSSATYGLGFPSLSTDEAGKQREFWTDALGRLIEVDEPNPSNNNYLSLNTCYSYDAVGDLTGVTQGSQTRTYTYDMLSRLTSAQTPESGTTSYYYTNSSGAQCSGNPSAVCRRTDARSITTAYSYDALNRLTSKSYSDGTPLASFFYDQAPSSWPAWTGISFSNAKGRLVLACTASASGTCSSPQTAVAYSYDAAGRVQDYWQCTPYNCGSASIWPLTYAYDTAGNVSAWAHPGGFTLTDTYNAAMQMTQMTSSFNDSVHPGTLATLSYGPSGALSTLVNGCAGSGCTPVQETYDYNNRLQPVRIQLGTSASNAANYCLVYNYYAGVANPSSCTNSPGTASSGNNGNVMGYWYQDNVSSNPSFSHTASYTYDSVNRLATAVATGSSTYNLTFGTDRYGNMTCVTNGQTNGYCGNYTFNSATNQISTSGFSYDAAGNVTSNAAIAPTQTYQWDAEGRVASVSANGGSIYSFTYNALGQRVRWVYTGGELDVCFDPQGNWLGMPLYWDLTGFLGHWAIYANNDTWFTHPNNLGSDTMRTGHAGTVLDDVAFYPWGDLWLQQGSAGYGFAGMPFFDPTTNTSITNAR